MATFWDLWDRRRDYNADAAVHSHGRALLHARQATPPSLRWPVLKYAGTRGCRCVLGARESYDLGPVSQGRKRSGGDADGVRADHHRVASCIAEGTATVRYG